MPENRITEVQVFRYLIVVLIFLLLAFNRDLGQIYMLMILGDYVWYKSDRLVSLETEKVNKRTESIVFAIGGYIVFFIANIFVSSTFGSGAGLNSVLTDLASTTPILQGSQILTLIGWGIVIPIIETRFFFGRLYEGALEMFGMSPSTISTNNGRVVFVWIVIGALFALFHITSKNLENVPLMMTFIFGVISCYLVTKEKQMLGAVMLHIFTNTTAVLITFRPELFSAFGIF